MTAPMSPAEAAPPLTDQHRQQVAGWRRLFVLMAVVSVASLALNAIQWRATDRDTDAQQTIDDCRSQLTAAVGDATAAGNIAEWKIVGALGEGDHPDPADLTAIGAAGRQLEAANADRQAFELDQDGCP